MSRPPPLAPGHEYLAPGYPPPMAPAGYGYVPPSKADEEYNDKVSTMYVLCNEFTGEGVYYIILFILWNLTSDRL